MLRTAFKFLLAFALILQGSVGAIASGAVQAGASAHCHHALADGKRCHMPCCPDCCGADCVTACTAGAPVFIAAPWSVAPYIAPASFPPPRFAAALTARHTIPPTPPPIA